MVDPSKGQLFYGLPEDVGLTPHRKLWASVGFLAFFSAAFFYIDVITKLVEIGWIEDKGYGPCGKLLSAMGLSHNLYVVFLAAVVILRLPVPYKLRRSEKQFIDSAFVVACSCWVVCGRGRLWTSVLIQGHIYAFHVIPFLNIWWDYPNFGCWDCVFAVLIEVALFCCRRCHLVVLMAVSAICVALQRKKNAYQQQQQLYLSEKEKTN